MKRGLYLPPFGTLGDVNLLVDLAGAAEAAGWDGFFLWDHIRHEKPIPFADPWIALSAIAATTDRIRLGPLVTPLPRRRPWKVAREAVTLDHLSSGRLVLGVGLGVDHWGEYSAFGEAATTDAQRAVLLDEGIATINRLWSGEFRPPPLQQPRIPLWGAARFPLNPGPVRRAATLDGIMPWKPAGPFTADDVRAIRDAIGRDDPYDIAICGQPGDAAAYEAAGLTWLFEGFSEGAQLDDVRQIIAAGP
ncbi:MAG TPA: LLM class flavin-dependent oxidoreductase [Acidimicrobiales bacterium]|nr:LLM class flavin-dependent oxidoreductase [Acidimicrobiales bacterium]